MSNNECIRFFEKVLYDTHNLNVRVLAGFFSDLDEKNNIIKDYKVIFLNNGKLCAHIISNKDYDINVYDFFDERLSSNIVKMSNRKYTMLMETAESFLSSMSDDYGIFYTIKKKNDTFKYNNLDINIKYLNENM